MPLLFCNIAWMKDYAGRDANDPPKGGGGYVVSEVIAGEELNFVAGDDGYVYGHFETIKNATDRQVKIERLGASKSAEFIDGVDVVWTAPVDGNDPRCVVGWYRNARVYRDRQMFHGIYPSGQHKLDEILSFQVRASAEDVHLIPLSKRHEDLYLQRGKGWSGQASWWYADGTTDPDAKSFVKSIRAMISGKAPSFARPPVRSRVTHRAGRAATEGYTRYVKRHEEQVSPRHNKLEKLFKDYLRRTIRDVQFLPTFSDDMRFTDGKGQDVMVEVKPTEASTIRFAIRTAMGQLLDYRQHQRWEGRQLIVVETEVTKADDRALALGNGFDLAWPLDNDDFIVVWPAGPKTSRSSRRR
ncbi:hypothetical protein L905_07630 [Agrobacterium sp. TS43]|uniref:hypothetical protein n=1 Tax=Agrobacterium TaxID=357 RepID=UPI00041D72B3|nr:MULTISPECIES: hypothetical protein [Agrobacterium]KVK59354.1 hypothetical protein L905_07630 [Agrobacterium sp. TS43]KVK63066.1 hypothetical protein L906_18410 [Agrobacterium sp. TS45]KVK67592.1 hypothetical protein L907_18385 [Agrobacterium sp. C13]